MGREFDNKIKYFFGPSKDLELICCPKIKEKTKLKDVRKCKNSRLGGMHWIKYDKHCVKHLINILKVAYTSPILGSKSKSLMFFNKTISMKVEMNKVDWSH